MGSSRDFVSSQGMFGRSRIEIRKKKKNVFCTLSLFKVRSNSVIIKQTSV